MMNLSQTNDLPEPFSDFDEAFKAAERRMEDLLRAAPRLIRGHTSHLASARGKMIRAAALVACAQAQDGTVPADAVPLAAAVELFHLATLVHDDVIDDADLRRGIPTIQRKYGRREAVICGDYLLSLALRTAAAVCDRDKYLCARLPDYVGRVCMGELEQQRNNRNLELTAYRYLRIIGGKTAALFEAAFYAGAILSTDDRRQINRYARLGRKIGMIFQLTDDCIDFELDEAVAKKDVRSDYEQGVITLPMIQAFTHDPALREQARGGQMAFERFWERVRACGGLDGTRSLSKRYYAQAEHLLAALTLPENKSARLRGILDRAFQGPQTDS